MKKPDKQTSDLFLDFGLCIRTSHNADLDGINELCYRIYDELCPVLTPWYQAHPEVFSTEFYGPWGQDAGKRVFYTVIDFNNKIVGTGGLVQKDPVDEPNIGEITKIYLDSQYRGYGLGKMLVTDLVQKGKEIGFNKLFLTTRVEFVAATALYQRLSFRQIFNEKYDSPHSTAWELQY